MQTTSTVDAPLDQKFVEEFGGRLKDAWNRHDAEAVSLMCTEDVSWNDAGLPEPARRRAGVAAFVKATARTFPDFRIEEGDSPPLISPEQRRVFVPYRMSGTMLGDWGPLDVAPTNRPFSVEGIDQWTFRGELICHYTTYYDSIDVSRQLGFMPQVDSAAHRVLVRMQHLQARLLRRRAPRP